MNNPDFESGSSSTPPVKKIEMRFVNDTSSSRRTSISSQNSQCNSPVNYDSGHYSSSNLSDLSIRLNLPSLSQSPALTEDEKEVHSPKVQQILREKEQCLFLAAQENRKLRSELERLNNSEKWYKNEYKANKRAKLELLEKFYLNERKSVQENQRLQTECTRLNALCDELHKKARNDTESKELLKELRKLKKIQALPEKPFQSSSKVFEIERQERIIADHEHLIGVLRKQKQTLLDDLRKISAEKDATIFELEKTNAESEEENRKLTQRYMELVKAKKVLESDLAKKDDSIVELREKLSELHTFKQETLSSPQKRSELELLRDEVSKLQKYRQLYEHQQRNIDEVRFQLQEKTLEIESLRNFDTEKTERIHDLEIECRRLQKETEDNSNCTDSQKTEKISNQKKLLELDALKTDYKKLSEKYSEICKICEKAKFDLDMKGIEVESMKFERITDKSEIAKLRENCQELNGKVAESKCKVERLEKEEDTLRRELTLLRGSLSDLNEELYRNRNEIEQMRENAQNHTCKKCSELDENVNELHACKNCNKLEEKYTGLRKHFAASLVEEGELDRSASERRIELLRLLLSKQSTTVSRLNQEQSEWEEVLALLAENQSITENPSTELESNCDVSEENELKYEVEIAQLHEKLESKETQISELKLLTKNQTAQILELERSLSEKNEVGRNVKYLQSQIARLQELNDFSVKEFNEVLCRERENFRKLEKVHLAEVDFLRMEKRKLIEELQEKAENGEARHFKLLNNVLKAEHERRIARYEVHIRTLLANIKSYKNHLDIVEKKHRKLMEKCKQLEADVEAKNAIQNSNEISERKFEQLATKYRNSLEAEKALKHQLETARNQFVEIDCYKSVNKDLKLNLTNLMDDYKKLIQPISTKQHSYNAIYDLINRSNSYVPNLTELSDSLDGLKDDLNKFQKTNAIGGDNNPVLDGKVSLLDELRAAEMA